MSWERLCLVLVSVSSLSWRDGMYLQARNKALLSQVVSASVFFTTMSRVYVNNTQWRKKRYWAMSLPVPVTLVRPGIALQMEIPSTPCCIVLILKCLQHWLFAGTSSSFPSRCSKQVHLALLFPLHPVKQEAYYGRNNPAPLVLSFSLIWVSSSLFSSPKLYKWLVGVFSTTP